MANLLKWWHLWFILSLRHAVAVYRDFKVVNREDLRSSIDVFSHPNAKSYGQLLFDIGRYQLIVGSRDYLFRLTLEGLKKLEEAHWPAAEKSVSTCKLKGKTEEDCKNYIKVLVTHNGKLFSCGTNAFLPECSWREINSLKTIIEWVDGTAKCPYSPYANSTALMTKQGDYYVASTIDFSGQDPVIYKIMGQDPKLRTLQFDPKWLSEPNFVASYEVDNFTYYFFREAAVEYINCGKVIYSRVARICKNDQGGQFLLKGKFTTFLKARLNCSIPGNYPFYYNEIQSIHFLEKEEIFYATFTTPVNSIYGSAICAFNMSSIRNSFNGAFKYQSSPKSAWERQTSSHKHFQCESTSGSTEHFLDSEKYQLMNEAVQPMTPQPILKLELERFSHIVVDVVQTKYDEGVHVMFVSTTEGYVLKYVIVPDTRETCLIEKIKIFSENSRDYIKVMKLLKDMNSIYIGTEDSVIRVPFQRCERHQTKSECLGAMDPYCGWNEYQMTCTSVPNRNPRSSFWLQEKIVCPNDDVPVDGGWSSWSTWFECSHIGTAAFGDRCLCRNRVCDSPRPAHGGLECEGPAIEVANCTRDGQWTEWSSWSSCSATCGLAAKSRRRTCGNPTPAFGGRPCIGPERDEIFCTSNPPCPAPAQSPVHGHWSEWSTWDECSSHCGGGIQLRRRRCNSPPPQHGGRDCAGCPQDFRFCNVHACPEVRKTTPWTPYTRVANRTKGGHYEIRFRFSCRANVPDETMLRVGHLKREERFCPDGGRECNPPGYGEWTEWSECSKSCGGGLQYKERSCPDCPSPEISERPCNLEPCPGEGWQEWSVWSLCDPNLEQHRRRKCLKQDPLMCTGPTKETRICVAGQLGASTINAEPEDGVHAAHVGGAFVLGLLVGAVVAALVVHKYTKKRRADCVAAHLVPLKPYGEENEWKNNYPATKTQKIPLREATIKRNGNNFRAQIHSDHNF